MMFYVDVKGTNSQWKFRHLASNGIYNPMSRIQAPLHTTWGELGTSG